MWNKVYLVLLAIGVIAAGFFAYYAWSWLQSIGDPRTAWDAFNYHKRTGVYFVICWSVVLLLTANAILWTKRSAWALWATHIFFAVFVIVLLVILHLSGANFCLDNKVCAEPSKAIGPLLATFGIVVLGVLIFLDQFVIIRMHKKMYDAANNPEEGEEENSRPDEAES